MRVSSLTRSLLLAASLPLAVLTFAPSAFAQEASAQDIAQARQLGQQAQAAYDGGNYAESEKLWAAAAKLYSAAPTLTLGLARTQAKLGKFVSASENYNKIIREVGNAASPPPAFKDALDAAKAEVGAVTAKLASVTLTVEGPASPQVTIDGQTVPVAALGLKRPVDPGPHSVKATAEGYDPAETSFTVAEGGTTTAALKMNKAASAAAVPGPHPGGATEPGGAEPAKGGNSNKTLALVAFGVGGAGLVVGAITGIIALGKAGDLNDKCADKKCMSTEQDAVDSYKSVGTISTIGFIVAGIGGAAGVVLLLTGGSKEAASANGSRYATVPVNTKKEAGASWSPYFGGTSAGITGRF